MGDGKNRKIKGRHPKRDKSEQAEKCEKRQENRTPVLDKGPDKGLFYFSFYCGILKT